MLLTYIYLRYVSLYIALGANVCIIAIVTISYTVYNIHIRVYIYISLWIQTLSKKVIPIDRSPVIFPTKLRLDP